ncbi:MAG: sortase [Caldilineaceae bacterium]|nr:sortase [Caldilineaceae bacterium]
MDRMGQRGLKPKATLWLLCIVVLCLTLLAGCSQADSSGEEAAALLPAGQDAPAQANNAPPLGPSLGANTADQPQRISLPSIGVETDVVKVGWQAVTLASGQTASQWEVANFAAGWHKNSSLPGQPGNVVLSGHNNIQGAVFRKLYKLQPGDIAKVWAGGKEFDYRVEEVLILPETGAPIEQRRENARWIQPFDDERLTLVSCWPETGNSHRVVVVAKPVKN